MTRNLSKRKTSSKVYRSVRHIIASQAKLFSPPERMLVTEAAEKYIKLNQAGQYTGPYQVSMSPYMAEPMDCLQSRLLSGVVFCGSAQSGKTEGLILGWLSYSIVVDPMDMIIYSPTQGTARDFSGRRIDRMHRHSKDIGKFLNKRRDSDNKFDKQYTNGMMLSLSWPTSTEFGGKPVGRIALTDYDRMPMDVEGEGSPFDLGSKRTTTFLSFAMTLAESSPSQPVTDPKYIKQSPHQAPPAEGILALYNRGDMRRWYWSCPRCDEFFEGQFEHLKWDNLGSSLESAKTARMLCPHCNGEILSDERYDMNQCGVWLKDGETIDRLGFIYGEGRRTEIASFWMNGVAASFMTWSKLVTNYLDATAEFDRTGSDDALKKFYNTDLGQPYIPKTDDMERTPDRLMARKIAIGERLVPEGVRALVAGVDVQKRSFVVQVFGIREGTPWDLVLIDRFSIWKSPTRRDHVEDVMPLRPATYLEDWQAIRDDVLDKFYELSDGSGRKMMVKMVCCDSGGTAGATEKAYAFYRQLREEGQASRFMLVKGVTTPGIPRWAINFPDSNRKDKFNIARGDVPVLMLNSNLIKDMADNRVRNELPGTGMLQYAHWIPDEVFAELCTEVRTPKGWEIAHGLRNEAWDILCYVIALCISSKLNMEKIHWDKVPEWLEEWDKNPLVLAPEVEEAFAPKAKAVYDFSALGRTLA